MKPLSGVCLLLVWTVAGYGQALSGTIVGTVTDQTGAAVPQAKVTLINVGTKFSRTVDANQVGEYVASSFPPGPVRIEVEHPGFQKLVREGAQLTAADTLTVDLRLQIGNVEQTLEVTEQSPLLQTQTATVSSLVSNQQILNVPLSSRSFTQLLALTPGVSNSGGFFGTNMATPGFAYWVRSNTFVSVNGSQSGNNSYLIDGMYDKGLWLNNLVIVPTIDSIQELRVLTSNYSSEYGDSAGGVTVVQSKSGTNEYHGSGYEYLQRDTLNANSFFNNRQGVPKKPFRWDEFGGTFGGPVLKNKTFLFGDYQGIRLSQPTTSISTLPSIAQKNMVQTGDFSGLGQQIYDPTTLVPGPNNTQVRAPFSGNLIPANRIDPVAVKLMNLLPDPLTTSPTNNYTYVANQAQRTDQFDIRMDQNLGPADRLFVKYSYDNSTVVAPGSIPAPSGGGVPLGGYVTGGTNTSQVNWAAAINYTKVIGTNIVNESRVGAVRWNLDLIPSSTPFRTAQALGIPGINLDFNSGGLPGFTISGGYANIGDASTFPEYSHTISYQYENITSIVKGSHSLKFGARYLRHDFNGYSAFPSRSNWDFNGQFTRQAGSTIAATALADFALGAPDTVNRGYFPGVFGIRFAGFAAFLEDSWRVNKKLTLTLGLRYEIQTSPHEVNDRWANFNVVTGKLMLADQGGNSSSVRNNDLNNFGPRVGIAYQPDAKTTIRTGAGVSYTEQFDGGTQLYKNLPYMVSQRITTDQNGSPASYVQQGLPFPVILAPTDPAINGGNPMAYPVDFQTPKILQWSFGVQRELSRDLMLETSYVGTRGINLMAKINTNQPFPGAGARDPRRPLYSVNPLVGDLIYHDNWGGSKYHSLQVRLQMRPRHGLSGGVAYTYSHNLINTGENQGGNTAQDARNLRAEWGNAGFDRRHMVSINHLYELPFGKGRSYLSQGVLSHIVGNWDISGIWSMMSGTWFTPRNPTEVSNAKDNCNGCPAERPNRIGNGNLPSDQRTIDRWFDASAFQVQPQFTFGNAANGILEGPGYFNVDLGVHRDFPFSERYRAQFRWEMFNTFNHANFNNPISTINIPLTGQINGSQPPRIMQLAFKFMF